MEACESDKVLRKAIFVLSVNYNNICDKYSLTHHYSLVEANEQEKICLYSHMP